MDESQTLLHYKEDSAGCKFVSKDTTYNNEIISHGPEVVNLCTLLDSLHQFQVKEDDVWLFNFPKAGTHWLHEIVGILLSGKLQPLYGFKREVMVETKNDLSDLQGMESPRLLNSHLNVKYIPKQILDNSKIIYIIRNPKSVAVSLYFHTHGLYQYEYEGTFPGFLPTYTQGIYNFWGSWFDHVIEMWTKYKHKDNVLFIFFEELKQDETKTIQKIAQFLGLDRNEHFCKGVAELTHFDKMSQHIGKNKEFSLARMRRWKTQKDGFFRTGTITDWKNHFTVAQNEEFDRIYNSKLDMHPDLKAHIKFE